MGQNVSHLTSKMTDSGYCFEHFHRVRFFMVELPEWATFERRNDLEVSRFYHKRHFFGLS